MDIKRVGPRQCCNTGAALTTNHLVKKGDSWLTVRLNVPPSHVQGLPAFPKSGEKPFQRSKLILTPRQSSFSLTTTQPSGLISTQATSCSLSCQTGKSEIGRHSKNVLPSTAQ